jgi:hypothetical protein
LGARLLLNKNSMVKGDGVASYVSNIANVRTFVFAGAALPPPLAKGHYYIKLGSTDDLYPPPCQGDDVTISHPNLGTDNLCIGHWYPINITDPTHADIANVAGSPGLQWAYAGLRTPGWPRLIRSISRNGGVVTVTTLQPHRLATGDTVTIAGVNAAYDGQSPAVAVMDDATFAFNSGGIDDPGAEYTGWVSLNSSSFLIAQGVEITAYDTTAKTLTVDANSFPWTWNPGKDLIYSPPNHIMSNTGPQPVFFKQFKTSLGTAVSFGFGVANAGSQNMDYAFTAGGGAGGAGFSTILSAQQQGKANTGIDFSLIDFSDAAIKIKAVKSNAISDIISFTGGDGLSRGRISHDGASFHLTSQDQPAGWTGADFGVLHLKDTNTSQGGFTKLTFSNGFPAPGPSAAIGAKFDNAGSSLWFGTSNSYPGVTNSALVLDETGAATFSSTVTAQRFVSASPNPALAGVVGLATGDRIAFRNFGNSSDVAGLQKGAGDVIQVGDATGVWLGANSLNTAIKGHLSAQANLQFKKFLPHNCETLDIVVPGAADGDTVAYGIPNSLAALSGLSWSAWVKAANVVSLRGCNVSNAATQNPPPALVRADVWKH